MEYIHVGRVHLGGLSQKPAPEQFLPNSADGRNTNRGTGWTQLCHRSKAADTDPELTWLDLNDNDLSGPIPSGLGDLSNLSICTCTITN